MRLTISLLLAVTLAAQTPTITFSPAGDASVWTMPAGGSLPSGYRTPRVAAANLDDSPRLRALLRDGNIYLSLQDAIALALENNLDLELERYGIRLADTDVVRSPIRVAAERCSALRPRSAARLGKPADITQWKPGRRRHSPRSMP